MIYIAKSKTAAVQRLEYIPFTRFWYSGIIVSELSSPSHALVTR